MIRTQANSHSSHTIQLQGSKENWGEMKGTVAPSGSLPALLPPEGYEERGASDLMGTKSKIYMSFALPVDMASLVWGPWWWW